MPHSLFFLARIIVVSIKPLVAYVLTPMIDVAYSNVARNPLQFWYVQNVKSMFGRRYYPSLFAAPQPLTRMGPDLS